MAAAPPVNSAPLHVVSPLVPSNMLSDVCGQQALVKLENTQPSGSFKIRGIGHYIQKSIEKGCDQVISSSGGNAGMAAAYSSKVMEIPATIVIPKSTPSFMVSKLKQEKADVLVHGEVWDVAHKKAITMAENKKCCLVHPFDHPDIWEGHSTIVDEILEQSMEPPAAIVVSVGGGGLLCGILSGLLKHGATDIPVVAMETEGANCLRAALDAGKPVSIGEITSIAKTLGALCVTQGVFELKQDIQLSSHVVSDKQAVEACINFADHHRMLVEPSCGAALAAGYSGLIQRLKENNFIKKRGPVVFIVCGGNIVSMDNLIEWKKHFKIC